MIYKEKAKVRKDIAKKYANQTKNERFLPLVNDKIWRPPFYQLNYTPSLFAGNILSQKTPCVKREKHFFWMPKNSYAQVERERKATMR